MKRFGLGIVLVLVLMPLSLFGQQCVQSGNTWNCSDGSSVSRYGSVIQIHPPNYPDPQPRFSPVPVPIIPVVPWRRYETKIVLDPAIDVLLDNASLELCLTLQEQFKIDTRIAALTDNQTERAVNAEHAERLRIDSAEDFKQCLISQTRTVVAASAVMQRHKDFKQSTDHDFVVFTLEHPSTRRFDEYTKEDFELMYKLWKSGRLR